MSVRVDIKLLQKDYVVYLAILEIVYSVASTKLARVVRKDSIRNQMETSVRLSVSGIIFS